MTLQGLNHAVAALIWFVICSISSASKPGRNPSAPQLGHSEVAENVVEARHQYYEPLGHGAKSLTTRPSCADNTTKTWCISDADYPEYEIKGALQFHNYPVLALYADVADLNTELSVEVGIRSPATLAEERYICASTTSYIRPLRAVNDEGKWRIIVNQVLVNYESYMQTVRIEECTASGKEAGSDESCPLVPKCYTSKCLQKSLHHRFLVYDPYDYYFPFLIENFKLPSACSCLLGDYTIDH
ncbi:unnamed protein product [Meganyctiphanes norvegica]|uniref:Spaetzle domain-containing protein n=1 Tax=Meganyctiphanes norvegica TaxID=48144 RepID=A0AAV2Q297_MEGNR